MHILKKNNFRKLKQTYFCYSKKILCLVTISTLLVGCNKNTPTNSSNNDITTDNSKRTYTTSLELASTLTQKYASREANYTYNDSALRIERQEDISLNLKFDPYADDSKVETPEKDIVCIYSDANLTQPLLTDITFDADKASLTISPPSTTPLSIYTTGLEDATLAELPSGDTTLFDYEHDWGNIGKYYMAQYVDLETGQKLKKPLVTVINVTGELHTPKLNFSETEAGTATFNWESVPNAEKYFVVQIKASEEAGFANASCQVIGETTDTTWQAPCETFLGEVSFTNDAFRIYNISEDDWLNDSTSEIYNDTYKAEDGVVLNEDANHLHYGVVAVSKDGNSMVSNLYKATDLAALLPYMQANFTEEQTEFIANAALELPSHAWVVMCDGTLKQKLINYDTANVETMSTLMQGDDPDSTAREIFTISLPYTIDGTPFTQAASIISASTDSLDKDLQALSQRQEDLRIKTGYIVPEIEQELPDSSAPDDNLDIPTDEPQETIDVPIDEPMENADVPANEPNETASTSNDTKISVDATTKITANSALSEYLAVHMLSRADDIDLTPFNESLDSTYVFDAWEEAIYQNPLILGVVSASISGDGKTLHVVYEDDLSTTYKKQTEIKREVEKIVNEIIKKDMTDLEKEFAINQYLCDNVTYDDDALENVTKYDFKKSDDAFNDSFTAYGALIKKVGVCASYAASFKLLADSAGLDSIVVNGNLDGHLPHAWNKVKIENEWYILDCTNNSIDTYPNALLNLSQDMSKKVLVENEEYAMDDSISQYSAPSIEKEYYRLEEKFFDLDSIANALAKDLKTKDTTILRTDYNLTDETFQKILDTTAELTQNDNIKGCYWIGVICITSK